MSRSFVKMALAFCLWLLVCGSSQAWWNSEWTIRKKITIDTSDKGVAIGGPIGTSAVLVRLHEGNFQFAAAKDDGSDIRFVSADDKTLLTYHVEKYDSLMSEAFVWVKVPELKPGGAIAVWLYYGNAAGKAEKVEDAKGTYDADTVLVYHFAEKNAPARDYSSAGNQATAAGVTVDGSMIGSGLRFDGRNTVTLPDSASLAWTEGGAWTWTAWVKVSLLQPNATIYSRRDGGKGLTIGSDNGVPYLDLNGQRSAAGAALAVNGWHHYAVVADGTKVSLWIDGEAYGSVAGALPALGTGAALGGFAGELDELEISKVARPAGAIKFAAVSQGGESGAKLVVFGEDEQKHSWFEGGYVGIILKSLTFDGWVVIGILMVMSAVSWWLMVSKVMYLNRVGKGNELFMAEWRHLAADLSVLDHGNPELTRTLGGRVSKDKQQAIRQSPVYRIFHIGAEEIRHRLAGGGAAARSLSSESIASIRASLDTGLVREMQRLNSLVVILTIAISGGPFLGLLGTVVGVMITFAAIAAAGDVNVNAIAPGIAAALVATVAGLVVAIPALFGYNYILSRIKDATSDMQVFVDEFITRMAEFYSGLPAAETTRTEEEAYASPGR